MASEPPSGVDPGVPIEIPVATAGKGIDEDRIRERAYQIWVDEGSPHGRDIDHWLGAKWERDGGPKP
jgi:Protein of unknown function (DUF2934)